MLVGLRHKLDMCSERVCIFRMCPGCAMSYLSQDDSISSFSQERLDLCPGMQNFGRRLDSGVATSMQNYSKSYDGTAYVNQQQTLPPTGSKEKQFQLIARHVPEGLRLAISAGELLIVGKPLIFAAYTATWQQLRNFSGGLT